MHPSRPVDADGDADTVRRQDVKNAIGQQHPVRLDGDAARRADPIAEHDK